MKTVIKTLFVWLLLCAIPFQGYASARMACGAMTVQQATASAVASPHAHAPHRAASETLPAAHAAHATHADDGGHAQDCRPDHGTAQPHGKCGTVGGCCIAFALVPSAPPVLPASGAVSSAVPFVDRFVPDIVPATLERPPRPLLS